MAISLLAVITALVYAYAPEKINSLDRNFVHFYLKRHREQLNQALLALKSENPEKGIQKLEGFLEYIVIIGRDGRVDSVDLENGDPALAGYGKTAISQWRYQPFRDRGESVRVRIHTAIAYRF